MSTRDDSCPVNNFRNTKMPGSLTLTGQPISPTPRTRPTSAATMPPNSPYSSSQKQHGTSRNVNRKQTKSRLTMALEFPGSRNSPRQQKTQSSTNKSSSIDYLSFFEETSPQNRKNLSGSKNKISLSTSRDNLASTSARSVDSRLYIAKPISGRSTTKENKNYVKYDRKNYEHEILNSVQNPEKNTRLAHSGGFPVEIGKAFQPGGVLKRREDAALRIQRWYKRHSQRVKASQAALKRLLRQKKLEMEMNLQEEKVFHRQKSEDDRKKRREERAQVARRQAIEELRKSREEQMNINKSIAEEEIAIIKRERDKKKSKKAIVYGNKSRKETPVSASQVVEDVEEKIERIFQETNTNSKKNGEGPVSRVDDVPDSKILEVLTENDGNDAKTHEESDSGQNKSQSLLESLLETIQQLEEEPEELTKMETNSRLDEKLAWIDEMQSDHHTNVSSYSKANYSAVSGAGDSVASGHVTDGGSLLTKAKLDNLMSFLDNVDKRDENYATSKSNLTEPQHAQTSLVAEETKVSHLDEVEKAASEVTSEVLKLRLEVDEKSRGVELLQKALKQQRELTLRHAQNHDKEMNQRLKMQKDQYESTIQRHLSFIDQLIDDKKILNQKCEKLVLEMKQVENKYQSKIKLMQDAHAVELKKMKEVFTAAEKLRREKWIDDKTRTIKELTVKGLEPEIQRLIAKHKQEMKRVKAMQEAELLQSDERAGQRYIRQTEELREQLEREKDNACTREREMARQRYEKQLEQEEMSLQQQRRRLYAEVADEKERLNQQAARQRSDIDKLKEQLENSSHLASSALTEEYKKSKEEAERRHATEIEVLKERLELEKQAWQENYIKRQEGYILQKERELKDAVRADRDSEIEAVIEQLDKDMRMQKDQNEKTAENRVKRIREKYENEMKEIEMLERKTQEKYNNMKIQFSDLESDNMKLNSLITHKDNEILDMKKIKDKLVEERGKVTEVIRDEFAERLVHTEEENKRMKSEVAQMRARHRLELDRVSQEKEEELAEVHKRVKAAIVKKEESISQIKQQHEAAVKRADHLEGLLEAQSKQLRGKKN